MDGLEWKMTFKWMIIIMFLMKKEGDLRVSISFGPEGPGHAHESSDLPWFQAAPKIPGGHGARRGTHGDSWGFNGI